VPAYFRVHSGARAKSSDLVRVSLTAAVRRARADQLRLYVCNNDQSVRVFALAAMRPLARIATPTPSNYCALAPGGGLLACVGDAPDRGAPAVYLYRPTPAGALPRPVQPTHTAFSPCVRSARPTDMPRGSQHAWRLPGVWRSQTSAFVVPRGGQKRSHEMGGVAQRLPAHHAASSGVARAGAKQACRERRPAPDALRRAGYAAFGKLRGFSDAGMSCAWSPSGACLAAASQDGRCTIWDMRTRQVPLTLP